MGKPHMAIPGCNFAGLTTARYINAVVKDKADITIIDRKDVKFLCFGWLRRQKTSKS